MKWELQAATTLQKTPIPNTVTVVVRRVAKLDDDGNDLDLNCMH